MSTNVIPLSEESMEHVTDLIKHAMDSSVLHQMLLHGLHQVMEMDLNGPHVDKHIAPALTIQDLRSMGAFWEVNEVMVEVMSTMATHLVSSLLAQITEINKPNLVDIPMDQRVILLSVTDEAEKEAIPLVVRDLAESYPDLTLDQERTKYVLDKTRAALRDFLMGNEPPTIH